MHRVPSGGCETEADQRNPGVKLWTKTVRPNNWTKQMLWNIVNGGN